MDESTETEAVKPTENKPTTKAKKPVGKIILIVILVLLLTGVAGGAGYMWRDSSAKTLSKQQTAQIAALQQDKTSLEKQLATEKAKNAVAAVPTTTVCTVKAPNAGTIDNIEASITSGNTAALEGYMAPSVTVVFAAAEGLPVRTPTQAVSDITGFISSDTSSWDYNFSLPAATLAIYRAGGYKQYIPTTAVVGKASNNKVIAFSFDCNAKISTVFMATNDALLK